jgi:hypothetical protein
MLNAVLSTVRFDVPAGSPTASPAEVTFRSPRYGYTITPPADWRAVPSTTEWKEGETVTDGSPAFDWFVESGVAQPRAFGVAGYRARS